MSSAATRLSPTIVESRTIEAPKPGSRNKTIFCLLLFALTLAFYNPISHDGFVLLDDVPYILNNPPVRAGLTWNTVKWSFTTFHAGYWHPLTWLSHALDCQLFGVNPAGHHYVSLLFHAANAAILFLLLEEATTLLWPSLLVAALFAVHPVNVESVAWAAERKNVLSMFFCLLALWAYGRYARKGGAGRYALVTVLFVLGLMAKPQIITLPCVFLLWDYWPLKRIFAKPGATNSDMADPEKPAPRSLLFLIAEKIPLFAIVVGASVLTVKGQRTSDAVRTLSDFSLSARIDNAIVSYGQYLADLFWPHHLAPLYPHPMNSLPWWQVTGCAMLLAGLTAATLLWKSRRYLAVGWLWFVGVLVPMIGIVQVGEQSRADRFVYVPMIGIAIAVVWLAWDLTQEHGVTKQWILVPAAIAIVSLGAATYRQLRYWKDGETLWSYALIVTGKNYMAEQSLAMVLDQQGRVEEAIPHFRAAETIHQFPRTQVLNLGIYEQRNGHLQDAIELYRKVLNTTNDPKVLAAAWGNLGSGYIELKNYDQAKLAYESALAIHPDDSAALLGSGLIAERNGDNARAIAQLKHAVRVEPRDIGFLILADALQRDHQPQEAQLSREAAKRISTDFAQAQANAHQIEVAFGAAPADAPGTMQAQRR